MGSTSPGAVVLDTGALVAFEHNDRKVRRLVELAAEHGRRLHIPAGVIGQVWRDRTRQACLARLIKSGLLDVGVLDLDEARAAGVACGFSSTADVIDASSGYSRSTPRGHRGHQRPGRPPSTGLRADARQLLRTPLLLLGPAVR